VASIRECGVLQPVLVRPRQGGSYRLIADGRRLRASRVAGLKQIPALVCRYDGAMVTNLIGLLDLSGEILELVERGELGMSHARVLRMAKDPEMRGELRRDREGGRKAPRGGRGAKSAGADLG
jgi:ParB-like chromosome segregation protein Spo0J